MTTAPLRPNGGDQAETDPDDVGPPADPWVPRKTNNELEGDDRFREGQPLKDYFQRMRERGLLD